MKYIILLLLLSGCNHLGLYTKQDVIRINKALIKDQQAHCSDVICESSDDLSRPEVVMRVLEENLSYYWKDIVGTEDYPIEYETEEWCE